MNVTLSPREAWALDGLFRDGPVRGDKWGKMGHASKVRGVLGRLRRDARGNALAIMAAALIPLCAFTGSAIDIARMYVVKTRLQTACDAGALAGRKFMNSTSTPPNTTLTGTAGTQADAYFVNNFGSSWGASGWYTGTPTKTWTTFSDSGGITQVSGNASAQVPMTIMRMFGATTRLISVSCQASFNTPDTDVMFVIDTTGSMACLPSDDPNADCGGSTSYTLPDGSTDYYDTEKSGSKLAAVRSAVDSFYTTLAANIAGSGANVRYGFVPYSSTVNAGQALYTLNPAYLATSWTYQSRYIAGDYTISTSSTSSGTPNSQSTCVALTLTTTRNPSTANTYNSNGTATEQQGSWGGSGNTAKCTVTTYTLGPQWTYKPVSYDSSILSPFIKTLPNGGTVDDPSKVGSSTTSWQGCVEEATSNNYNTVSSYNIDALPPDMNPDLMPNATTPTPWAPMWPAVEYGRNFNSNQFVYTGTSAVTSNGETTTGSTTPNYINTTFRQNGFVPCGNPVQRLTAGQTQAQIDAYTANLHPHGGTYHDTGMIWGLRMLSPQGIFANDTAKWTGHADPKRVIVFLTDGAMSPDTRSYGMYGTEYFDSRISGNGPNMTSGTAGTLKDYHNARFLAECQKAQEKNVQVWVVAVGQSLTTQLQSCVGTAHPERAIPVNSTTDLQKAFASIATAISMLRVSQ